MKATVSRTEIQNKVKTGLFSSKMVTSYNVRAAVEFTEEELAIIKRQKLGGTVVHSYKQMTFNDGTPSMFNYTIDFIVKNGSFSESFDSVIDASAFERKVKEELLPKLKGYISESGDTSNKSETLEF